jgi:hypothetical protein
MISTTERGKGLGGLVRYLFGSGRHEEHTNQRIIASSDPTWTGTTTPDRDTLTQLIAELDDSHVRHAEVTSKGHVLHLIVSVPARDGILTDEQWRHTAERFAQRLGIDDGHVAWAAVNHGLSAKGNDHIHMVINLIRDDGKLINLWRDALTRREVCRDIETEFGLTTTAEAGAGDGQALSRYEAETLRARQPTLLPRHRLAALVRAAAEAATGEADFLRLLRAHHVIIRPRPDKADPTSVVGYSVALPGKETGGKLIWFGGGTLHRTLRLPALRVRWTDPTPATAAEWRATGTPRVARATPEQIARTAQALLDITEALDSAGPLDADSAATLARDCATVLAAAACSTTRPDTQRHLLAAFRAIDRLATHPQNTAPARLRVPAAQVSRTLLTIGHVGARTRRVQAVLQQATRLASTVADRAVADERTRAAQLAADRARATLSTEHRSGVGSVSAAVNRGTEHQLELFDLGR